MTRRLLDTHCHVEDYPDALRLLDEAARANVSVVAVTRDPGAYRLITARLGRRAGVHPALGLHPLQAHRVTPNDLARFFRLLPRATWIGEIGLDFSPAGAGTRLQQLHVFDAILSETQLRMRPVTVHSRGAEKETVRRLIDVDAPAILHWYTGPLSVAEEALAGGLLFSVNPAMIQSRSAQPLLRLLPPSRVLLETDGPFAKRGGRPARPSDLPALISQLATTWQVTVEYAAQTILENQIRLAGSGRDWPTGD